MTSPFYWTGVLLSDLRCVVLGHTDDVVAEMDKHGGSGGLATGDARCIDIVVVVVMLRAHTVASAHFYYVLL